MLFSFLPFVAFGTGEGLLRYGIRIRCSKRLPGVRGAFSEARRAENRLLGYRKGYSVPERGFSGTDQTLVAGPGSKMRLNAGPGSRMRLL